MGNEDIMRELVEKMHCNSFGNSQVYLVGSLINHSCFPNTTWDEVTGKTIQVFSHEVIPKGSQLFLSYNDTPFDLKRRVDLYYHAGVPCSLNEESLEKTKADCPCFKDRLDISHAENYGTFLYNIRGLEKQSGKSREEIKRSLDG